jgi:hypothetical protein
MPSSGPGNLWQNLLLNRINPGTVLTGTLQNTLSSKNSHVGDQFSIVLDNGYSAQNMPQNSPLIPAGTKVLGAVTGVTSARIMRNGQPGNIQVSLQTIVFPDGRWSAILASIQPTPQSQSRLGGQGAHQNGPPWSSYASSAGGMGMSFISSLTRMVGFRTSRRQFHSAGQEFVLPNGERIAVRLNQPFDLNMLQTPATQPVAGQPNYGQPMSGQAMAGQSGCGQTLNGQINGQTQYMPGPWQSGNGQPMNGQPQSVPGPGQSGYGQPMNGQPQNISGPEQSGYGTSSSAPF